MEGTREGAFFVHENCAPRCMAAGDPLSWALIHLTRGAPMRLDLNSIPVMTGTGYPAPFDEIVNGRSRQALGKAGGLTQFGVNLVELKPGAASSQRHWHSHEDEFVMVVSGELTLVTDEGETLMRAGDCAAFPAGRPNA